MLPPPLPGKGAWRKHKLLQVRQWGLPAWVTGPGANTPVPRFPPWGAGRLRTRLTSQGRVTAQWAPGHAPHSRRHPSPQKALVVLTGPASECQRAPSSRPPGKGLSLHGSHGLPLPVASQARTEGEGRLRARSNTAPSSHQPGGRLSSTREEIPRLVSAAPTHPQSTGASGLCGLDQALGPEPAENK